MTKTRRRKAVEPDYDLPEIDYPEASPAPQDWRTYDLDAPGYEGWQFTCMQPSMQEWAKSMEIAGPIFDEISEGVGQQSTRLSAGQVIRYFQKFGELWDQIAKVAAKVVVSWNFRDTEGNVLPNPFHNYKLIADLPTPIARPFGMEVLNFLAWASGGEEEAECQVCGATVQVQWAYCPECQSPVQLRCVECERPLETHWKACPFCGVEVAQEKN